MGRELLKMADGFAMVVEGLRELAGQAVEEVKPNAKQESKTGEATVDNRKAAPKVAVEANRMVLSEKSHVGKKKAIKELLGKYGVAKLSAVKQEDYPALLQEAKVL